MGIIFSQHSSEPFFVYKDFYTKNKKQKTKENKKNQMDILEITRNNLVNFKQTLKENLQSATCILQKKFRYFSTLI